MFYVYDYYPTDSHGREVRDKDGCAARKRFLDRDHCEAYASAMRLRYPNYRIERVMLFRRRYVDSV